MATSPSSRPDGIPPKPPAVDFEEPVAWLFGRQFIATLKYILLYTAFKGKLDSRDWMKAEIIDIEQLLQRKFESRDEFWWDYISDSGDGQKAMYSIAFLCMSDLAGGKNLKLGDHLEFLSADAEKNLGEDKTILPRGAFLFVGGDTSYHISDYGTLASRFQNPFWWAFDDLNGRESVENRSGLLFGIPGNHDYYDSLDGFNRQFRRPSNSDEIVPGQRPPLLKLPTFIRTQEASYVALHLPFDWWFWGLDTEEGEIDFRQLEFFTELRKQHQPKKLIVATPEPTIAYGQLPKKDANQSKTFAALGLERPVFNESLASEKCRVDLAGDIHHYARYFGPAPASGETDNYTSVMAGGGGAFFHPSQTNAGEVPQQRRLYPPAEDSRNETAKQLFKVINIWKGGNVWLFGFLIAFALVFTAYLPPSGKEAVDTFPPLLWVGASPADNSKIQPTPGADSKSTSQGIWTRKSLRHYLLTISFPFAIGILGATLFYSSKLFKKEYDPEKALKEPRREARKKVKGSQRALVWILVGEAFAALALGLWGFRSEEVMPPYGRSLIILAALLWAGLAVLQSILYSEWLFEESYHGNIKTKHYWPIWVLLFLCVVELGAAFWFFGTHESAYLIADLVQIVVILGISGGLIYFAVSIGGHLQKGIGKAGFFVLGASHALLQLAVPFLLVRKGHLLLAPFVAFVIVGVFQFIGSWLAKFKGGWLAIGWVALGAALLITPFLFDASLFGGPPVNNPTRWLTLLLCVYAGGIGAIMSCALFGWYLAVALAFNGHNNEAGGAARIEGFKHLIRFRLNRAGLTGYVIAIDKAGTEEKQLTPKIVDIFHISNRTT